MMRPTCSLLMPLMMGNHGHDFATSLVQVFDGWSLTSNSLPTARCELAALPMPSNCR